MQKLNLAKVKKIVSIILILILYKFSDAQDNEKQRNWTLNGYLTNLQTIMFEDIEKEWTTDNLFHNRINFKWYISNNFTSALELRNRFIYGESIKLIPDYARLINNDKGFVDLSDNLISETSFLLHSTIDRCWIDFNKGKMNIRAGRQRINWAQSFVWNPNDIFNTYSFFDFDYEEKPGSDAIRIQYYTGNTSSAEIAVKADCNDDITAAGLLRFNKWNYDFQFLGGLFNSEDYIIGTGWSGQIKGGGFRGEVSYFHPASNFSDTSGVLIASISGDYTFKNSLFLQFELLYNETADRYDINNFGEYYYMDLSAKNLSFTKYSLFGQILLPLSPLVNSSLSIMYFPEVEAYFVGPSLNVSLKDNLDLSFLAYFFSGELTEDTKESLSLVFLRMRWSF